MYVWQVYESDPISPLAVEPPNMTDQYEFLVNDGKSIVLVIRQWLPTDATVKALGVEGKFATQEQAWTACETLDFKQYRTKKGFLEPRMNYACGDDDVKQHSYSQDTVSVPVDPWNPVLKMVRDRSSLETGVYNNACLVLRYDGANSSIGWHPDREVTGANAVVITVSVGESRQFEMKRNSDGVITSTWLHSGDAVIMCGTTQQTHVHRVPKEEGDGVGRRYSLTFRYLTGRNMK